MQENKKLLFQKRKKIVVSLDEKVVEQIRALAVENGLYRKNAITGEAKGNLSRAIECLAVEAREARAATKK